jgi:hypothetical protein
MGIESELALCVNMLDDLIIAGLFAAAALLLTRTLPPQNVALILGGLIACEILLEALWIASDALWRGWLFWPSFLVLTRMGWRWILRRWNANWHYGICLIVLASATAALLQFAIALPAAEWSVAPKLSAVRFAAAAVCLFWLSPWFISKLPQQPQDHAD